MMVAAMSDAPLFASLKKKVPYTLIKADCVEAMQDMPDASVDAVVCDPPAGIAFMGKEWDKDKGGRDGWVAWMTEVMCEALRVLKPGGHAVVWALPRTSHWTALALEDAGFEVRDAVLHCFGTGFPKSQDISKFINKAAGVEREIIGEKGGRYATPKQDFRGGKHHAGADVPTALFNSVTVFATDAAKKWAGWGSALKPSQEIWWLCRKPLDDTLAANTLKHGVGGLNIDGCRVGSDTIQTNRYNVGGDMTSLHGSQAGNEYVSSTHTGRWPSNLLLSHSPSCIHLDTEGDTDLWACVPGCPVRALDAQSGTSKSTIGKPRAAKQSGAGWGMTATGAEYDDIGGASRYFMRFDPNDAPFIYQAKANTKDRSAGIEGRNSHPTVKSTSLMAYLCRLVTPPGGVVLDPFMGSGSTGVACIKEGFRFIGIEREAEYYEIAKQRVGYASKETNC